MTWKILSERWPQIEVDWFIDLHLYKISSNLSSNKTFRFFRMDQFVLISPLSAGLTFTLQGLPATKWCKNIEVSSLVCYFRTLLRSVRDVTWISANAMHWAKWTVALVQVTLSHLNKCPFKLTTWSQTVDVYNMKFLRHENFANLPFLSTRAPNPCILSDFLLNHFIMWLV